MSETIKALAWAFAGKAIVFVMELAVLWWMFCRLGIRMEYLTIAVIARWWFAPRQSWSGK